MDNYHGEVDAAISEGRLDFVPEDEEMPVCAVGERLATAEVFCFFGDCEAIVLEWGPERTL